MEFEFSVFSQAQTRTALACLAVGTLVGTKAAPADGVLGWHRIPRGWPSLVVRDV